MELLDLAVPMVELADRLAAVVRRLQHLPRQQPRAGRARAAAKAAGERAVRCQAREIEGGRGSRQSPGMETGDIFIELKEKKPDGSGT